MLDFGLMAYPNDPRVPLDRSPLHQKIYQQKYEIMSGLKGVKKILEIGVRAGYSAYTFMQAFPDAAYIGLDANNGTHGGQGGNDGRYMEWAKKILSPYNACVIECDTQKLHIPFCAFDFIHVDGDHTPEGVYHDLELVYPSLAKTENAAILVDDYTYLDTVKEGVDLWLGRNCNRVQHEFIDTIRGDVLIRHKSRS